MESAKRQKRTWKEVVGADLRGLQLNNKMWWIIMNGEE